MSNKVTAALDAAGSVALIAGTAILIWTLVFNETPIGAPSQQVEVEPVEGLHLESSKITNVEGQGEVAIVEFVDFECPFCRAFAKDTLPKIRQELVDSGTARYISLHYPLERIHSLALRAAEAAECAGRQGQYWSMSERLFTDSEGLQDADLVRRAEGLRLDAIRFERCMAGKEARDKIRADSEEGRRLGVTGTPSFFVGIVRADGGIDLVKRIRGSVPFEVFAREVSELADAL